MFTSARILGAPVFKERAIPFGGGRTESLAARWALAFTPIGPPGDGFGRNVVHLLEIDIL